MHRISTLLLTAVLVGKPSPAADVAAQIAKLSSVDQSGIGYSASVTGEQFLPQPDGDEAGMVLMNQKPAERSDVLTAIVAAGAEAIPQLIACLEDKTPTKVPPMRAMMWQQTTDEYDVNRRTTRQPATAVNEDSFELSDYVTTVGDLCYVALGQIVNRRFNAVRYQASGGLVISSPSLPQLRAKVRAEWGATTASSLRDSLVRDFVEPDHHFRKLGALRRLMFYFPAEVPALWKAELARPIFDVFAVERFARGLYEVSDAQRATDFAAFVKANGPAASEGLVHQLFHDLIFHPAQAAECLAQLYGLPRTVTREQEPPFARFSSKHEREELEKLHARLAR
jgi:hypothetical protein